MGKVKEYMMMKIDLIARITGIDYFVLQDLIFDHEISLSELDQFSKIVRPNWSLFVIEYAIESIVIERGI